MAPPRVLSGGSLSRPRFRAILLLLLTIGIASEATPELSLLQGHAQVRRRVRAGGRSSLGKPSANGAWEAEDLVGRDNGGLNECIAEGIRDLMKERGLKTAADYGAGSGAYGKWFKAQGVSIACYDGNPTISQASGGLCRQVDLSVDQTAEVLPPADLVYSLEVAEHIPHDREAAYLGNIDRGSTKAVVLSWAPPGQPGDGHVNCQTTEYAIERMRALGHVYNAAETEKLRKRAVSCLSPPGHPDPRREHPWNGAIFGRNVLVFTP